MLQQPNRRKRHERRGFAGLFAAALMTALLLSLAAGLWFGQASFPLTVSGTTGGTGQAEWGSVRLTAVGDVMLARKVGTLIDTYGNEYPLARVKDLLQEADIAFANLESPIGTGGTPLPGKGIWFRAKPETVKALTGAGFDVVSLANNHVLDYDSPPLLETLEILKDNGIHAVGAGKDIAAARQPVFVEKKGVRVAFLAYTEMANIIWSYAYPRMLQATETEPGVAPLVVENMVRDIKAARQAADLVVVSLHWGAEYVDDPAAVQRQIAYELVDAGADLIVGHHPHTLQGVEIYENAVIAYSLGNFVFDQSWSDKTEEGLVLHADIGLLGIERVWLEPVVITEAQPEVAQSERGKRVLAKVRDLSRKLGTSVTIDGYAAILHNELN